MKLNKVGTIVGTHGIKGEVKVKSDTSFDRFIIGSELVIKNEKKQKQIIIDSHRVHKNFDLITFSGYKNINDVLDYIGFDIYIDVEDLDDLEDDEYYYDDLIGLTTFNDKGEKLGTIVDINEVPQGIILELKKLDDKIALIPFVEEFIKEVNLDKKILIITPIEGLL